MTFMKSKEEQFCDRILPEINIYTKIEKLRKYMESKGKRPCNIRLLEIYTNKSNTWMDGWLMKRKNKHKSKEILVPGILQCFEDEA